MIGITEIASWTPENSIDNLSQAASLGSDADFARDRIGAERLPEMPSGMETSDLAAKAVESLLKKSAIAAEDVQCLVVCTQNPDGCGLPHTSAIVQSKAGLSKTIASFDYSLGCSGYVYGLHIVKGFMESAGLNCGILVTADPYSKIIDRSDRDTAMLFGDSATATLLTSNPRFGISKVAFGTDGSGGAAIRNNKGRLEMAGRQVFNFAATNVPRQINSLLDEAGKTHQDIDLFALHQGSRYIVETLTKRLKLAPEKVPVALKMTGNTVSSSIPLILENRIADPEIKTILVSGFGVGLSWATAILERTN